MSNATAPRSPHTVVHAEFHLDRSFAASPPCSWMAFDDAGSREPGTGKLLESLEASLR
jgi:hypothetical protein